MFGDAGIEEAANILVGLNIVPALRQRRSLPDLSTESLSPLAVTAARPLAKNMMVLGQAFMVIGENMLSKLNASLW